MAGADDDAPVSGDSRKSRKQRKAEASPSFTMPDKIVCTKSGLAQSKNSIELGAIFSIMILALYLYGFMESVASLPEVSTERQLGENLNLAKLQEVDDTIINLQNNNNNNKNNNNLQGADGGASDTSPLNNNGDGQENKISGLRRIAHYGDEERTPLEDIPVGIWPVSVKKEEFETMIHSGDQKTVMSVPKFWSKPLHAKQQFTKEQAMRIGTCAIPDASGSFVRGTDCPVDQRTIFIAIASYRDFQCRYTLESAFNRAAHPERIRVAVVDQVVQGEDVLCDEPIEPCEGNPNQALCKYKDRIDVYQMEAQLSVGPVFARHIGHRMYRGEYYSTQSDAHVTFTQDWDSDIISQMEATHNEMAVLSTYLTDVQGSIDENGNSLRHTRPIMCNTYYEGGHQGMHLRHGSQPERVPAIHGMPQLSPWWAAGYSFSRGHFVVNVPYDNLQPMIFQGEEMSIGIRGFTIGYDYYAPERSVCFHHYAVGENAKIRNKVKHFWENGNRFPGVGVSAMSRLLGIVHMNPEVGHSEWDHTDEDIYGLGGVRTPEQFYKLYGIDVVEKTTEGHLCKFVDQGGQMHKQFTPHLRPDGMGIDYTKIHFEWKDPTPDEKHFK